MRTAAATAFRGAVPRSNAPRPNAFSARPGRVSSWLTAFAARPTSSARRRRARLRERVQRNADQLERPRRRAGRQMARGTHASAWRPMCSEGQVRADLAPALDLDLDHGTDRRVTLEAGRPDDVAFTEDEPERRARVVRDATVALARVSARVPDDDDGPAAEGGSGVGRVGHREATVPERRAAADDARPDPANDDIEALGLRPRERRRRGERLDVAVEARRYGDGRLEQLPRLQQAQRVRQRHGQRTPCELHVRDPHPGTDAGDDRSELAVQPAAHDRKSLERLRQRIVLLDARHGGLPGRVRKRHHVRPRGRRHSEPPRQVRVDDVEAAGAEAEVAPLRVDAGPCLRPPPARSAADRRRTARRRPRSG